MIINKISFSSKRLVFVCVFTTIFFHLCTARSQQKFIKIMSYNVLKYGNGCQGPNGLYHTYLKTIVTYVSPDIIGLIKVASIPERHRTKGIAPIGFADSILAFAFNAAFPNKY